MTCLCVCVCVCVAVGTAGVVWLPSQAVMEGPHQDMEDSLVCVCSVGAGGVYIRPGCGWLELLCVSRCLTAHLFSSGCSWRGSVCVCVCCAEGDAAYIYSVFWDF